MEEVTPNEDEEVAKMMGHTIRTRRRCYVRTQCINLAANCMDLMEHVTITKPKDKKKQHDEEQEYNGGPDEGGSVDEYKGVRVITLSFTIGNLAKLLYIQYAISDSFFQTMKMEDKYSHGVQVPQTMVLIRRLVSMIYFYKIAKIVRTL